jgi:hypothetical protein
MKLKFITDNDLERLSLQGRRLSHNWVPFIEELYKHPNRWAEFPEKVNHSAQAYNVTQRYKDIEVKITGGNSHRIDHPDKKQWTVYVRYVPDKETQESVEIIEEGFDPLIF